MKGIAAIILTLATAGTSCGQAGHTPAKTPVPGPDAVIAMVLGQDITAADKDELNGRIFSALLEKFAQENIVEPTDAELDAFVAKSEEQDKQQLAEFEADQKRLQQELQNPELSTQERQEKQSELETTTNILESLHGMDHYGQEHQDESRQFQRELAQQFVMSWKINRSLFQKYGGRVIFQQAGPEPLDAYRDFLKEQEKHGAFRINDATCAAGFWNYFTNDTLHTFFSREEGARCINTPWWLMDPPAEK